MARSSIVRGICTCKSAAGSSLVKIAWLNRSLDLIGYTSCKSEIVTGLFQPGEPFPNPLIAPSHGRAPCGDRQNCEPIQRPLTSKLSRRNHPTKKPALFFLPPVPHLVPRRGVFTKTGLGAPTWQVPFRPGTTFEPTFRGVPARLGIFFSPATKFAVM